MLVAGGHKNEEWILNVVRKHIKKKHLWSKSYVLPFYYLTMWEGNNMGKRLRKYF